MNAYLKILHDNIKSIITGDYDDGITDLNTLGNLAIIRVDRKREHPSFKGLPTLTKRQKRAIKKFYSPYVRFLTDRYHLYYTNKSGKFYPEYLPEELYATDVDRYFSDREEARFIDNKCYYYRLFSNVKQPDLVVMRIGGTWLDAELKPVLPKDVIEKLKVEDEVVLKRAVNSEGGFGVEFLKGDSKIRSFCECMKTIHCDVVVQRPVKQHSMLSKLHEESVNTIRIVSLMTKNEVKIYATCLKIGVGKSRVDNACHGGIYCGVKSDGYLKDYGMLDDGEVVYEHPDLHYKFSEQKVPCLDQAYELVKEAHSFMGHFRLISWDVAIDEHGDAVLIEANLSLGGISDLQISTGPLFGTDTKKILDEVFRHKRRKWTTLF